MEISESDIDQNRLRSLPIHVSIRVCRKSLKLKDFLKWTPGTVLNFDQPATSPLTLFVSQQEMGAGRAVKVDSSIGLQLSRIKR